MGHGRVLTFRWYTARAALQAPCLWLGEGERKAQEGRQLGQTRCVAGRGCRKGNRAGTVVEALEGGCVSGEEGTV